LTLTGNLKIVVYYDLKTRYLIINHKGTGMFKDGGDLTGITNQKLEKIRLDFQTKDAQTLTLLS